MKIEQLLLTTDFSNNARRSYSCAASLSRKLGARLHLVHFAGDAPGLVSESSSESFYGARERALHDEVSTSSAFQGLDIVPHLQAHRWTPDRFRALETDQEIDMVVMGTHGRTGVQHFLLGSFAERVVRNSAVPVLIDRKPESQPEFEPKLIAVPFEFSEVSDSILPAVRFLSSSFPCSFRFIYVDESVPPRHVPVVEAVREFWRHTPTKKPIEEHFHGIVKWRAIRRRRDSGNLSGRSLCRDC